jgi:hypothetical protein
MPRWLFIDRRHGHLDFFRLEPRARDACLGRPYAIEYCALVVNRRQPFVAIRWKMPGLVQVAAEGNRGRRTLSARRTHLIKINAICRRRRAARPCGRGQCPHVRDFHAARITVKPTSATNKSHVSGVGAGRRVYFLKFRIHFRGFFSSITAHVAAVVIPPSATSSKTSSGVPIGVILATRVRPLALSIAHPARAVVDLNQSGAPILFSQQSNQIREAELAPMPGTRQRASPNHCG